MPEMTRIPTLPRYENIEEKVLRRDRYDEAAFKQMIRSLHLKVTEQRLLILEALHSGKRTHVTAQEVYEIVSQKDSSLGFATVYRFLRKLTESGLVTEVRMGGLPARYEITPKSHHDHLTCTHCGKICEFENNAIEELQKRVAEQFGFNLTSHVLELYGVCQDCQRREARLARTTKP
jgi:Fur family ferric uptake transcriptional regulator